MAARELRHTFLATCARKRHAALVILAHHADDQSELFLMRLLRGAGGTGLGGMRALGASPADPRVRLFRPLLECSKAELVEFARARRIRFRVDASNLSDEFDRNWVRLRLLPLLRQRRPSVERTLSRSMGIAQADSDYVREAAISWLGTTRSKRPVARPPFEALHVAVQRQVVQEQLLRLGCEPEFQLIERLRLQPDSPVSVSPGRAVVRDEDGVVNQTPGRASGFNAAQVVIELPTGSGPARNRRGSMSFGSITLEWRVSLKRPRVALRRRIGAEIFDARRVGARWLLRHWRPGDRFQPIGLRSASKLQDWFTNRKIPAARRRELVLGETERGEVFWVEGERIGEVAKITSTTRRVLELRWKRD